MSTIEKLPRLWNAEMHDSTVVHDEITMLIIEPEKAQDGTGRVWDIKGITEPDFQFCDIVTLCHCTIDPDKNLIDYLLCFYF